MTPAALALARAVSVDIGEVLEALRVAVDALSTARDRLVHVQAELLLRIAQDPPEVD